MKKLIFYNLIIFFSLSFFFLEFIFPFFFNTEKILYEFHNDRTVTFVPNETLRTNTDEFKIKFKTNNFGFNDYDFEGKVDILILGDSFVEAIQVKKENHFAEYIKNELNLKVAKIGMSGYGNSHYYSNYLKFVKILDPKIVLIINVFNDIENNFCDSNTQNCSSLQNICKIKDITSLNKNIKFLKIEKNDNHKFNYSEKIIQENFFVDTLKVLKKFQTYYSLRTIYSSYLKIKSINNTKYEKKEILNKECQNVSDNIFAKDYYNKVNSLLYEKIVKIDKKKILFININYPDKADLKFIKQSLKKNNYPHINLDEEFSKNFEIKSNSQTIFKIDGHWNKYGHELVGKTLNNYLKKNNLAKIK